MFYSGFLLRAQKIAAKRPDQQPQAHQTQIAQGFARWQRLSVPMQPKELLLLALLAAHAAAGNKNARHVGDMHMLVPPVPEAATAEAGGQLA